MAIGKRGSEGLDGFPLTLDARQLSVEIKFGERGLGGKVPSLDSLDDSLPTTINVLFVSFHDIVAPGSRGIWQGSNSDVGVERRVDGRLEEEIPRSV